MVMMDGINANLEAKLKELLYRINSLEIKICSGATKEFIKLLKGEIGRELLHLYVRTSPKCLELLDAWKIQRGRAGIRYIFSLISAILSHPDGKYNLNDTERISRSRVLDMLARSLVEESLGDINSELGSQEVKHQNAALLLMSSIVRRGSSLGSEVAKNFDFKLRAFSKLAEYKPKPDQKKSKHLSRKLFVGFAMSFLEVGKPELLRWVLQQREMYYGVFRGLGNDDEETIIYVLSTLRDKILVDESLVPPGLRSVLFGNVTLEQLAIICGKENGGPVADVAYQVLVMVCTDPCNGLMPDLKRRPNPLKGNSKRVVMLMRKLRATGVVYHRDLLLEIVRGRPFLCSSYLEEFPYNLEDFLSPSWFSTISFTTKLVSCVTNGLFFGSFESQLDDIDAYMKSIIKCLSSHPFSRSVINKGLLHSNILVKHGTLRLLLEALKLVDSLIGSLNRALLVSTQRTSYWLSIKQEMQYEVQTLLPDPQVLLTLLSSLGGQSRGRVASLKRCSNLEHNFHDVKKLKTMVTTPDTDIIVCGVISAQDIVSPDIVSPDIGEVVDIHALGSSEKETELMNSIAEIWDLNSFSIPLVKVDDIEIYFLSKLLDALKIYRRTVPNVLEGSFETFINLLGNPLSLPTILQHSLLSLLIEYIESSSKSPADFKTPPGMYRHLQPFLSLFIFSPDNDIKDAAYYLAQAAILSTGAFDQNVHESGSWFLFLSNYDQGMSYGEHGMENSKNLVHSMISFLCDAISTVGNNLFKYWGLVNIYINKLNDAKDVSPNFSPIIICVLQKCLRLLSSESSIFTVPEKSMISAYVSSTLKYILQTQVNAQLLASVIVSILSESFDNHGFLDARSGSLNCEWKPLKNLVFFSKRITSTYCGDSSVDHYHLLTDGELICSTDINAIESSATGDSFFMKWAPFHVMFPAVMCTNGLSSLALSKIQDLLLCKLNELTFDPLLFSYLRLVLFWAYQIRLCYRMQPMAELQQLSQICFTLLQNLLDKLLALRTHSGSGGGEKVSLLRLEVQEVAETIFSHPAVVACLSSPLNCQEGVIKGVADESLESLIQLSGQKVNTLDRHIINLLTNFCNRLWCLCDDQATMTKEIAKAFNILIQSLFCEYRDRFDLYMDTKDLTPLLPPFFAVHALNQFISPFDLLELVTLIFSRVGISDLMDQKSHITHGLLVGFCLAVIALKDVTGYLQLSVPKRAPYNLFWEMDEKKVCNIIEEIYTKTNLYIAHYKSEFADKCLLEAIKAICAKKSMLSGYFSQISLTTIRLVMVIPSELISYCIYQTNKAKAKLLFLLTGSSPLHLSIFGYLIMKILNRHSRYTGIEMEDSLGFPFSDEEFLMLLPTALSYLNSVSVKFGEQCLHHFKSIPSVYSRILFQGFLQWEAFVSKSIFYEEYGESVPSSTQELISLVNGSLLGKAIKMLRYHFAFNGDLVTVKKRLKVFKSIFPASAANDEVLEFEVDDFDSYSPIQRLNVLNKVVAKLSFCRVLLFPEGNFYSLLKEDEKSAMFCLARSNKVESSRLQFLNILVTIWRWIVKKHAFVSDTDGKEMDDSALFRYLEVFILKSVHELSAEMHDALVKLESIPFLEQLMRFSLLYRFEDPTTINILCSILHLFSDGNFAPDLYLQLLVAHSQFAPTIHSASKPSYSIGTFLMPMSSILRSLVRPSTSQRGTSCQQDSKTTLMNLKRLQIVKLLHILVQKKARQGSFNSGKDAGINLSELHSLLLSSYGATTSEADSTILKILNDIETIDGSDAKNLAQMDFLWGSAALRVAKEQFLELDSFSNISNDAEALKERRRNQFRENLPVHPKICASTVLYFPHDRAEFDEPFHSRKLELKNLEGNFHDIKSLEQYDPVYILRFAMHALSMEYIEAMEFASLGLLAIAFVCLSSANDRLRKLAYETLGALKDALEKCKRRKGTVRLRLLLTYVQNGIEEPWQRIPSIISLFAAETSFILLEPSHDHYAALSKFLMHSSRMNKKSIPLFQKFLWSSSVSFKSERLWILRLVYAGINVDDDARLYCKNSILEDLQSFYVSPLADDDSKELILQIIKKSSKLQKMAHYLVQHNGLLSWLSCILSTSVGRLTGDERSFFTKQLILILEVVNDVISFRSIIEWLQKQALEQLMEFSSHLFKILLGGEKLLIEGALVNPILQIIISTLKMSQKRKIYQPHFTLSIEALFHVYQAVHRLDCAGFGPNSDNGLKVILMSMPLNALLSMDLEKCSNFLSWAISTALESDSRAISKGSHCGLMSEPEEEHCDESLTSKLLRWLSAAVILGKISSKVDSLDPATSERSNVETLYSLLEHVKNIRDSSSLHVFGCEELIAANILYLLQHLKGSFMALPTAISALCLLLFYPLVSAGLFHNHGANLAQLLSKIHCPQEVNPAWRWTFYQAWKDYSLELTDLQKMDELHACQTLQVVISNILSKKPLDFQALLPQDIELSKVFEWERSLVMTKTISISNS